MEIARATRLPRVVAHDDLARLGISPAAARHRLARGQWTRLRRGVYLTAAVVPTRQDGLVAALLASGADAALTGGAALRQWGFRDVPMPPRPTIAVPARTGPRSTAQVRIRRSDRPATIHLCGGTRVVDVPRAVVDLGLDVARLDLIQSAVSEAIRRRFCTALQLEEALAHAPQRGSGLLRIAVEDAAFNAWSVPEARIGRALRAADAPPFQQNVPIFDAAGRNLGIVDVWWERYRAALEIHGARHHSSVARWNATVRRAARLGEHGIAVLQIPAVDVLRDLEGSVARILRWLAGQRARGDIWG